MLKKLLIPLCIFSLLAGACHSGATHQVSANGKQANDYIPSSGTIVAAANMPVTDDPLNHFNFSVKVSATPNSKYGVYDVTAAWGPDTAKGSLTMPQGGGNLKPVIRKAATPYTYIIGFYFDNDKTFYDYYQVSGQKGNVEMKYIKGYSFK